MSQQVLMFTRNTDGAVAVCPKIGTTAQRSLIAPSGTGTYWPTYTSSTYSGTPPVPYHTSYWRQLNAFSASYATSNASPRSPFTSEYVEGGKLYKFTVVVSGESVNFYPTPTLITSEYVTVNFKTMWTRTASSGANGTVSTTGGGVANNAATAYSIAPWTVTATPSAGYVFNGFTVSGSSLAATDLGNGSFSATLTAALHPYDAVVVASFTLAPGSVTATKTVNPTYGILSLVTVGYGSTLAQSGVDTTGLTYSNLSQGVRYILLASVPTASASIHKFDGWYTSGNVLVTTSTVLEFTASPTVTYYAKFSDRANYTITKVVGDGSGGTSTNATLAITPAANFDATHWLENTQVTISATCLAGYHVYSWTVSGSSYTPPSGDAPAEIVVTITANTTVTAVITVNKYTFTAEVDTPSLVGAVSSAGYSVEYNSTGSTWLAMPDGGVVAATLVRFLAEPEGSYEFAGWYRNGILQSTLDVFQVQATENLHLVAKFSCAVSVGISNESTGLGKAEVIDATTSAVIGTATPSTPFVSHVTLGESITLKATGLITGAEFKGWFNPVADPTLATPLSGMSFQATVTPTTDKSYTARFMTAAQPLYIWVTNGDAGQGLGELSASSGEEIDENTYVGFVTGTSSTGISMGADKYYRFASAEEVLIGVTPLTTTQFLKWRIAHLTGTSAPYSLDTESFVDISTDLSFPLLINQHYVIKAVYRSSTPILVKALYYPGSNITMGVMSLSPVGNPSEAASDHVQGHFLQGTSVSYSATSANGYVFEGWFSSSSGTEPVSTDSTYTVDVDDTITLYAKFSADTDAIYKWEGGTENKRDGYRSKRFVSSKPFNPSSARVYADAYPVTLNVYMASSPDAPPLSTPTVSATVRNQNGFRLPMARAEKYLEIEVESQSDVTEIVISTSMEGLSQ